MRKIIVITFFMIAGFLTEFLLFNDLAPWLIPNLLLLLVMFFDLYFGIRYGLYTAVLAGLIKDSFSSNVFGIHLSSFVVCAYMTTILKRYIYHMGSRLSRYILIFLIAALNGVIYYCLYRMFGGTIPWDQVARYILLPQVVLTLIAAPWVFRGLKQCVSRLFD